MIKPIAITLALAQTATVYAAGGVGNYWQSFNSSVDPTNITIPSIPQISSLDVNTECVYYQPETFTFNQSEWPSVWETATSNGMNETAEFRNLYNSIDWSSMPNISVRTLNADGSLDMSNYDANTDPDCWWSASTCTVPKHKNINADIYYCPEPETWGLTYDDGPNCSHNAFYDYLEENKLKATMFYIGSNVIDWPYGAMRGLKDGHHIADHTWSHQLMTTLTNEEVLAELYYTQKAIKLVTGVTPRYWRPAFGDVDDRVRWIATQLNLTTILWNLDTSDWAAGYSEPVSYVQNNYNNYIEMGTNGSFANSGNIVLTHEINNTTMQLALDNLPKIQQSYKHVVDVATCQNITYPYFEKTIAFAPFSEAIATNNTGGQNPASVSIKATGSGITAAASATVSAQSSSSGVSIHSVGIKGLMAVMLVAMAALA